ncbi:MAG: hypothetical protein H6Q20_910, partial [Bacteroidetes bacterium]|nr:hypothetical protein [Bacteroidota bacterium]
MTKSLTEQQRFLALDIFRGLT